MSEGFPRAARAALADRQMRANLRKATTTIRAKRQDRIDELPDWERLREEAARIKDEALRDLGEQLQRLERAVTAAGGTVHWARDAAEANAIVARLTREAGAGRWSR